MLGVQVQDLGADCRSSLGFRVWGLGVRVSGGLRRIQGALLMHIIGVQPVVQAAWICHGSLAGNFSPKKQAKPIQGPYNTYLFCLGG